MPDHAYSSDPAVQTQLDRLAALSPGRDILGLERIAELCARLGNPQLQLPRTFHVAGTNGKGSTCAYLRAILEAQGRRVHAYTSPHLVRFNERIRLAGTLIDDMLLAALLEEVLDEAADREPEMPVEDRAVQRVRPPVCVGPGFDRRVRDRALACAGRRIGVDSHA